MRKFFSLFLLSFSLSFYPCIALSQPKERDEEIKKQQEAQKRFEEAEKLYNIGDFEGALQGYKEAYLLSNNPDLLYNMGQCYRKLGKNDDALITYRSYLREVPNTPIKADVEARIAEVEKAKANPKFSKVVITSDPIGAEVHKGASTSRVIGVTPFTLDELPIGEHVFTLTLKGFEPFEINLTTEGGKEYIVPEAKLLRPVSYKPDWSYRLSFAVHGLGHAVDTGVFTGGTIAVAAEKFTPDRKLSYGLLFSGGGGLNVADKQQQLNHIAIVGTAFRWKTLKWPRWKLNYGVALGAAGFADEKTGNALHANGQIRLLREGDYRGAFYFRPLQVGLALGPGFGVFELSIVGVGYSFGLRNKNPAPK